MGVMTVPEAREYDAFISYSHAADGKLAPALQRGLQQLGRPWRQRRAMEVFRDETGLAVNPDLWGSIVEALDASAYFLLLASPQAAQSQWVGEEIKHCAETKGVDKIIVVLTEGTLGWDPAAGDFTAESDATHPELRGLLTGPPRVVDLTWARRTTSLTNDNELFRSAMAQIAALIRGRDPEDELAEDAKQRRHTRRVVRAALTSLAAFTALAVVSATFAVANQREAETERDRAERQARIALARQFSAQSRVSEDPRVAVAMALEGAALDGTPDSEGALLTAVSRSGLVEPLAILPERFAPDAVYSSAANGRISLQLDGPGLVIDPASGTEWQMPEFGFHLLPDGERALSVNGPVVRLGEDGSVEEVASLPGGGTTPSFSRDGSRAAYLQVSPAGGLSLVVADLESGEATVRALPGGSVDCLTCEQVALSPDGQQVVVRRTSPGVGQLEAYRVGRLGEELTNDGVYDVDGDGMVRYSDDGSEIWVRDEERIVVLDATTLEPSGAAFSVTRAGPLVFLDDDRAVAAADACQPPAILQAPSMAAVADLPADIEFTEVGCVPQDGFVAWLGDGSRVVTASGIWPVGGDALRALACEALGGPVSAEEFAELSGVDFQPVGCRDGEATS